MANYVNVLDNLNFSILNGGSVFFADDDVWFWDYHLSKPHTVGNISFVPRYCMKQLTGEFVELPSNNLSLLPENLFLSTNSYYMQQDYTQGTFIFSKTTRNMYYLNAIEQTIAKFTVTGEVPLIVEGSNRNKLTEYRAANNTVYYANIADSNNPWIYSFNVTDSTWAKIKPFPTGWNLNNETTREIYLHVDSQTNNLYLITRNLYIPNGSNKNITYAYRVHQLDLTANEWVLSTQGSFDLYQYGTIPALDEQPHSPGRTVIFNGKLHVFNIFTEVYPAGQTGRDTYLSYIIINLSNGAIEKNDWTPVYQQSTNCTSALQAVRYGNYMCLINPDCPSLSLMIELSSQKINYLRMSLGTAQGTNTIRSSSFHTLCSAPQSRILYDPRERKTYSMSWSQGNLIADYSFEDQIYTDTLQMWTNTSSGIEIYVDMGTGSFNLATTTFNSASNILTTNVAGYLKRFRVSYNISSNNIDAELYKIYCMADPTHIWVVNSQDNRIDNDQFNNIVVGTPTAARLYKIQNKTGYTTTAVKVFVEADGDTGSYFTEVSKTNDTGFVRHCTSNLGSSCSKGFSFGARDCASGRCGGYEKATLSPTPQALPPNQTAIFYARVNVPAGQTRINRQARVIAQLEY